MSHKLYFILIIALFFSCKKRDSDFKNINHLKGVVMEVTKRIEVANDESDIFSFYISGLKFNADGTFELLDDGYGDLDYWMRVESNFDYLWTIEGSLITFTFNGNIVEWELLDIGENQVEVLESFEHIIKVSEKQEVR